MHALLWTVLDPLGQLQAPSAARRLFLPRAFSLSACIHSALMYTTAIDSFKHICPAYRMLLMLWHRALPGLALGLWFLRPWSKRQKYADVEKVEISWIFIQGQGSSVKSSAARSGFGNETSIPKATLGTSTTAPYRITLAANLGD